MLQRSMRRLGPIGNPHSRGLDAVSAPDEREYMLAPNSA